MPRSAVTGSESLLDRRIRTLGSHSPLFYDTPIELVSGRGVWVKDSEGHRYLDAYNNVPHVGHAHPAIANAVSQQMRKLALHTRYLNERVIDYAETLLQTFGPGLDRVSFGNSGSDANELALRVARHHSGASGILISDYSYHGTTLTLAQATTGLDTSEPRGAHVRTIHIPDGTGLSVTAQAKLRASALREVDEAIASLQDAGFGVASLLIDTLFSTEGLVAPPKGYVEGLVSRVQKAGGLFIADEVQSGFGRTGTTMWGFEHFDVVPDIVTMGKPMGNGHPLGAAVMRAELLERFGAENMYFNTFGGNPVSAAAGRAVLDVMAAEGLQARAAESGPLLLSGLTTAFGTNDRIESIRGCGLFVGIRFVDPSTGEADGAAAKRVVEKMKQSRVLISRVGPDGEVLKIRPPLAFEQQHATLLLDKLQSAVESL